MDPYLEDPAFWPDFHRSFITYCRDLLLDNLPSEYEARIDEQVRLMELPEHGGRERRILPDVSVLHDPAGAGAATVRRASSGSVATLAPVAIPMPVVAEVRDAWIEILHRPERSLVTVIELLSPTNKIGQGFGDYMSKRRAVLERRAHLVVIDLLVSGERIPLLRPLPRGHYYAFVTRDDKRPMVDVYSWGLRDRLPTIPVPLRAPDPDVPLDLAALFAMTYDRGRYVRSLRYGTLPQVTLEQDDSQWAQATASQQAT